MRNVLPGVRPPLVSWVDFKVSLRMLRKHPMLTIVSVLPLAVAIAAAAGAADAIGNLVQPRLPLPGSARIVAVQNWNLVTQSSEPRALHDFMTWQRELASLVELGAYETYQPNLTSDGGSPEPLYGSKISPAAFRIADIPPILGRPLLEEDARAEAPNVVVIGHNLWRSRFGADPAMVGRTIRLDAVPFEVVGVMPADYRFPYNDEIWVPLRTDGDWQPLEGPSIVVFGRLRDGVGLDDVQARLGQLGRRAALDNPDKYGPIQPRVMSYGANFWEGPTLVLSAAKVILAVLLLVLSSTVGVLLFVRNLSREREIAMRYFLGASRRQIVAQLFLEALAMASVAAGLGLLMMTAGLRVLYASLASAQIGEGGLPFWFSARPAPETLWYILGLTLLSAVLSGLLPALALSERRRGSPLRRWVSGGGTIPIGLRGSLVIAGQTSLMVGLLALVSQSPPAFFSTGWDRTPMNADRHLIAEFRPGQVPATNEEKDQILRRVRDSTEGIANRLAGDRRTNGITLASALPGQRFREWGIEVEGRDENGGTRAAHVAWVDANYFEVLGIPLFEGRAFEEDDLSADGSSTAVAVINRSFAREWFGNESPIGERVRFVGAISAYPGDPRTHPWAEVVGVVDDVGMEVSDPGRPRGLYLPLQTGTYPIRIAIRTTGDPADLVNELRTAWSAVDPWLQMASVTSLSTVMSDAQARQRTLYLVLALATLAVVTLSLSAVYAVVSFFVAQRSREIGIRIALGGHPARVMGSILSRVVGQLGAGVAVGIGMLWLLRIATLESVGWGALALVSIAAVGAVMLACVVPALRVVRAEPIDAIRNEG